MRKPAYFIRVKIGANQLRSNHTADHRLCHFILYFINLKFQVSNHLLRLYSLVCVGPGRKPKRQVFLFMFVCFEALRGGK